MSERMIELLQDIDHYPEKTCPKYESGEECGDCQYKLDTAMGCDIYARKADYLIAKGVVCVLCKVGDTVYRIVEMSTGIRHKINRFHQGQFVAGTMKPCKPTIKRFIRCVTVTKQNIYDCCEKFGKTVFLAREEAEQVLENM